MILNSNVIIKFENNDMLVETEDNFKCWNY